MLQHDTLHQRIFSHVFSVLTATSQPVYLKVNSPPVEVGAYEGASWLYGCHIQRLQRTYDMNVGADGPEAAEVLSPNQQRSSLTHGSHIQLPEGI